MYLKHKLMKINHLGGGGEAGRRTCKLNLFAITTDLLLALFSKSVGS